MIKKKKELLRTLEEDKVINKRSDNYTQIIKDKILYSHDEPIWKYIKLLRRDEYYSNKSNIIYKFLKIIIRRKRNRLGMKLGFSIPINVIDSGLKIWHYNVTINGYAKIGKNCVFHGNNCVGNNSFSLSAPVIGNNVDIGVGAKIIGDIEIADDIVIGANSVVTKSFYEKGIVIAGIPAKKIKNREEIKCSK